jgi:hypothetical protein
MTTLLSRLRSATGSSRELDIEIALLHYPWLKACPRDDRENRGNPGWMTKDGPVYAERYTESTDAALALVPPNLRWQIERDGLGFIGLVWDPNTLESKMGESKATPAIAVLIAIIRYHGGEFEGF